MSGRHRQQHRRRTSALLAALTVAALATGVFFAIRVTESPNMANADARVTPPVSLTQPELPTTSPTTAAPIPGVTVLPSSATSPSSATPTIGLPVRLTVPSIGINTALQSLSLQSNGTLQSPSSWNTAGWYAGGVRPGDIGPAVIAGHIDSTSGPAVFYRLHSLTAGAQAMVTEQDGAVLTFVVDGVQSFPKDDFPSSAVYGPTPYPELRLVTCTGDFDYQTHNYLSNLVVSAHLISGGAS